MPPARANAIVRRRLISRLNDGLRTIEPRLTAIIAPAGYGKSTVAAQWLCQLDMPFVWLSLDSKDNDPARFLAYLCAAIEQLEPAAATAAFSRLGDNGYPYASADTVLTLLLNTLESRVEPLCIALDDVHLITAEPVIEMLRFVLDHAPASLHVLIISRNEPQLDLALRRARGELQSVGAQHLRLSFQEALAFIRETMGVALDADQVKEIERQTEGWVTGLQLAAMALLDAEKPTVYFSGEQRHLADYLAQQVFEKQSEMMQRFLLSTSILESFCAELCDALLQQSNGRQLLRAAEDAQLFLIPLDDRRQSYRYHHLFGEFLRSRLADHFDRQQIQQLHWLAAHWYCEQDQPLQAVEHAFIAEDFPLAIELLTRSARDLLMAGEVITLRRWLERLPSPLLQQSPQLELFYAWVLTRSGGLTQAGDIVNSLKPRIERDAATLRGEWSALRARIAAFRGETDRAIGYSQKALRLLPEQQWALRNEVSINLGFSHLQLADVTAAREAFRSAATLREGTVWSAMFAAYYWGQTFVRQGELASAFEIYQQMLATAEQQGVAASPALGFVHVGLGAILAEWNQLDLAEHHQSTALTYAERAGDHKMLIYARIGLMRTWRYQREFEAAKQMLQLYEEQTGELERSYWRFWLALQAADYDAAANWAQQNRLHVSAERIEIDAQPAEYILLGALHIAQKRFDGLAGLLAHLDAIAAERGGYRFRLNVCLLHVMLYAETGQLQRAERYFNELLASAARGNYISLFLEHARPALVTLLHRAAATQVNGDYAGRILTACGGDVLQRQSGSPALTPRELELLTWLAHGISNRQIAEQMVVSINTVKAHARRLYQKLDVNSRGAAVARARELGLL